MDTPHRDTAQLLSALEQALEEAPRMLINTTSEDTLYSKWRNLPFAFKDALDGKIKFRVAGIARYLAGRI